MVGEDSTVGILLRFLFLLAVPDLIHSFRYPIPVTKRFTRSVHLPAYVPVPVPPAQSFAAYQPSDYDENYVPVQQTEELNNYEKTPVVPVYGYFPPAEKHDGETYGYVEEEPSGDQILDAERNRESSYPYGQETYFEGGNDNEDPNAAFLQNLILDQVYRDAAGNYPQTKYSGYEDDADRHWSYGIPVTEVEYNEGPETEDESVRELESLREPGESPDEALYRKLQIQKKASVNSRKNRVSIDYAKKSHSDKSKKIENERRNKIDVKIKGQPSPTVLPPTEKPKSPQGKSPIHGQKEYVLPRPANPVRRPFERVERASVYNTIKRLLSMEDQQQKDAPRIQKRFILNEDQLTSQLSGLKKMAV